MKNHYLLLAILLTWLGSCGPKTKPIAPQETKVALRAVGHELLLAQQDTTSLVLPVMAVDSLNYMLEFQEQLSIRPDSLVAIISRNITKAFLPQDYIVEVLQCTNGQTAYSYQVQHAKNKEIIPCGERQLPKACYTIQVSFLQSNSSDSDAGFSLFWLMIILVLGFSAINFFRSRRSSIPPTLEGGTITLGSFTFYPTQHKLVSQTSEINLSKKECQLLELLAAQPNQIIPREELTKKIWEDNGVVVGRSLDTYVSKLRKKLQGDPTIQLTNVHGVGYKLEVS